MTPRRIHIGLLLLRLGLGALLLARGYNHLFVLGIEQTTEHWRALGLPYPLLFAPLMALLELLAGPLLMLGLGTRPLAGLCAVAALGTLVLTRLEQWQMLPLEPAPLPELLALFTSPPVEGWWLLFTASAALAAAGAGAISVDGQRLPPRNDSGRGKPDGPHPMDAVTEKKKTNKRRKT